MRQRMCTGGRPFSASGDAAPLMRGPLRKQPKCGAISTDIAAKTKGSDCCN